MYFILLFIYLCTILNIVSCAQIFHVYSPLHPCRNTKCAYTDINLSIFIYEPNQISHIITESDFYLLNTGRLLLSFVCLWDYFMSSELFGPIERGYSESIVWIIFFFDHIPCSYYIRISKKPGNITFPGTLY